MSNKPAILGGPKTFPQGVPFNQPTLPAWEEVAGEFEAMYRTGWLTKGPHLQRFEEDLAAWLGVKHVVAVSSCTSGLILSLQSLNLDKKRGEIIVPSFSFMATFHSLHWDGYKPVFVDCEGDTFTVDPKRVREAITPNTVGIMVASTFGNPPAWEELMAISREHDLPVFSDSAHGMGTLYHGKRLGGNGDFEVFSLSPTKVLTAGEGGVVATNRDDIDEWVRAGRDYGNPGSYDCPHIGLNARMSEFHAILGRSAIPYVDGYAEYRNEVVKTYKQGLANLPGISYQTIRAGARSSYKDFAMVIDPEQFGMNRDTLAKALLAEGVPTRAYFHPAGHQLSPYRHLVRHDLSQTERISAQVLCLPISSHISLEVVADITKAVERIHESRRDLEV